MLCFSARAGRRATTMLCICHGRTPENTVQPARRGPMSASEVSTTGGGDTAASPGTKVKAGALGWYTVWMTTLVAVMSQIDRGVLSLFVQPLKRDYVLSDTQ